MEEPDSLRWRVDGIDVARGEVVRRQELAKHDHEIENGEDDARDEGKPVALEFPPHELPLRSHVDSLLLLAHHLRGGGIEGRGRHKVFERLARRRQRCHIVHFVLPPCSLMRGSSTASARSEMSTPITVRKARNIRNEPARYMSWLFNARISRGPVVSSDSTIAVISAPEMIAGRIEPMSAMKKLSAMRNGYLTS